MFIISLILGFAGVGLTVLFISFWWTNCNSPDIETPYWTYMGLGLLYVVLTIVFAVVAIFSFIVCAPAKDGLEDAKLKFESYKEFLPRVEVAQDKITELNDNTRKKLVPIKAGCEELYKALQLKFNHMLDERDWNNLDLLIYYFETGRAVSIREALQLVDRELQTQRIEFAITEATKQICSTLVAGFTALNNNITNCCIALSNQLTSMQNQQMVAINELTSSVNLNNALRAKANVTSEQLMNDVHEIRRLAIK